MTDQQEREAKAAADKYFPDAPYMDCREHRAVFMAGFVAARATIPQGMRMVPEKLATWLQNAAPADLQMDDWTRGYEEAKRRGAAMLAAAPQQPAEKG